MNTAPVITRSRKGGSYPQDGERIGPAWETIWNTLSQTSPGWASFTYLAGITAHEVPVQEKTVHTLLAQARKRGLIEVRHRMTGTPKRIRSEYRIAR